MPSVYWDCDAPWFNVGQHSPSTEQPSPATPIIVWSAWLSSQPRLRARRSTGARPRRQDCTRGAAARTRLRSAPPPRRRRRSGARRLASTSSRARCRRCRRERPAYRRLGRLRPDRRRRRACRDSGTRRLACGYQKRDLVEFRAGDGLSEALRSIERNGGWFLSPPRAVVDHPGCSGGLSRRAAIRAGRSEMGSPGSGGLAVVPVVKSTDLWNRHDATSARCDDRTRDWRVLVQRQVSA